MDISLHFDSSKEAQGDLLVVAAFNKKDGEGKKESTKLVNNHWPKHVQDAFAGLKQAPNYKGNLGETLSFTSLDGGRVIIWGLGQKSDVTFENLRREAAKIFKGLAAEYAHVTIDADSFTLKNDFGRTVHALGEGLLLANYGFDKYLTVKRKVALKNVVLYSKSHGRSKAEAQKQLDRAQTIAEAINFGRDLVNEPPNVLHSESYAKILEQDAKSLKRVKIKILNKAQIKKENMNLLLSVNAASAYEPRVVHLSYEPAKANSKTKHIALVGKGLTFDTGGLSLKPGASMMGMKFDMAGSATVYAAFRAAVALHPEVKLSCFLGITDNAVSATATMPDSIIKARNGKSVEILNTDAEGRLVLGDVLDYACDQGPDIVIDAATLTGAMLVAMGTEVCGFFSNNQKLADALLHSAGQVPEYMWQLPIVQEYRDDIKSQVADIKNIGSAGNAGSAKGAVFLEHFIKKGVAWAHLDIAGVAGDQAFLPYCPPKGASGIMVRTLVEFILNGKHAL